MNRILFIPVLALLPSCALLDFENYAECMAAVDEEISAHGHTGALAAKIRELGEDLCVNVDSLADLADVREMIEDL